MKTDTIVRTVLLILALVNQILTICGFSPIPIEDETVNLLIASAATVIAAVWSWWKNNSFTGAAIQADAVLHAIKSGEASRDGNAGDAAGK